MNWINTPLKPLSLVALALLLGSGLASATEPVTAQPSTPMIEATKSGEVKPDTQNQVIHLAWDRVGATA